MISKRFKQIFLKKSYFLLFIEPSDDVDNHQMIGP